MKLTNRDVIKIIADYLIPIIEPVVKKSRYTYCQMIGLVHRETFSVVFPELRKGRTIEQIFTNFTGDRGHGHSPFQIDDRSHLTFIRSGDWKDLSKACSYAIGVLDGMRATLIANGYTAKKLGKELFERCIFASYNCGAYNVIKALKYNSDPDRYTLHGDYSEEVFRFAEICTELQQAKAIEGKDIKSKKKINHA